MPTLHSRASEWYEQNGFADRGDQPRAAAEDFERAADLAELAWPAWQWELSVNHVAWLGEGAARRTGPRQAGAQPWVCLGLSECGNWKLPRPDYWTPNGGWNRHGMSEQEAPSTETCPERPEQRPKMVVVDEEQFRSLPASLATARAYHAQAIGDVPGTVKYTRRVLDLIPEGDHQWRGAATALLGLAYWASGDLEAAHRTFSDGLASVEPP